MVKIMSGNKIFLGVDADGVLKGYSEQCNRACYFRIEEWTQNKPQLIDMDDLDNRIFFLRHNEKGYLAFDNDMNKVFEEEQGTGYCVGCREAGKS